MELWIRSQDKEKLLKVDEIHLGLNKQYVDSNIWINNFIVGEYATKERALEILDEIQELIKPKIITTSYECECKDNLKDKMKFSLEMNPIKTEMQELSTYVYEMPKE